MLQKAKKYQSQGAAGGRFVIVASRYNATYVNAMVKAATKQLETAGAELIEVVRVPGAYEIPVVTAALLEQRLLHWSAAICLGVIIRGQTVHAQFIGEAVTRGLMEIQLEYHVPVIHEVLLVENEAQARQRCLDKDHNRGCEAAATALEMAGIMRRLGPGR